MTTTLDTSPAFPRQMLSEVFFGISYEQAMWICIPEHYNATNVQPKHVVAKLDALAKVCKIKIK